MISKKIAAEVDTALNPKVVLEELIKTVGVATVTAFIEAGEHAASSEERAIGYSDSETGESQLSMVPHCPDSLHFRHGSFGPFVLPLSEVALIIDGLATAS